MTTQNDRTLPLRERKKLRTRKTLAETALRLFLDNGFDAVTVDDLVAQAEVSKRTFYANYTSKEDVALAAELDLWKVYVEEVRTRDLQGPVLAALREALTAVLADLGDDWARWFLPTRGLAARTPALRDHSVLLSMQTQETLVDVLEAKLGIDSRDDVRLRLLGEFALSAWRCGAKNWIRGLRGERNPRGGDIGTLIDRVDEAFNAIPDSLTLTAS
ncbi:MULTISPECIES: TetR/AcrR family transcriptional regulator [Amycolatopsis]|uniref:TetR/AcrR family transcriptional regulator n=1 Tax=Amycolatopsis thermalba TaxID=944492 RepID=A0ABY4NXK5_9PSEU|nr:MULTISPECIES: TetR family transcriptional regulator [Amycolatopsis]OXM72282.1 TetR family transcriptional regulator [Amycolatopsis sp. KNN50.9b]UQS24810.1 TetR/AcrR family transcriptional regulator [Amycolatopsis thermalba]